MVSRVGYTNREASPEKHEERAPRGQGAKRDAKSAQAFRTIPSFEECFPNSQKVVKTVEHDGETMHVRPAVPNFSLPLSLCSSRALVTDDCFAKPDSLLKPKTPKTML